MLLGEGMGGMTWGVTAKIVESSGAIVPVFVQYQGDELPIDCDFVTSVAGLQSQSADIARVWIRSVTVTVWKITDGASSIIRSTKTF